MAEIETFVGIDVSKTRLDVHIAPAEASFAVGNDEQGWRELTRRLAGGGGAPCLVVLEATGGLQERAAAHLAAAGLAVAVVNPRQVRAFARATGQLAKTDRLDAAAIARFAAAVKPAPRPLPDPDRQRLIDLVARRRQLVEMRAAERVSGGRSSRTSTWPGSPGRSTSSTARSAAPCAPARSGAPRTICSPRCPASARSPGPPSSPRCPSSAP
jgi:transposase